jgi:hypothetical protein
MVIKQSLARAASQTVRRLHIFPTMLLLLLSVNFLQGFAQQLTGTLTGTVRDQTGAVVPGAQVTLTNATSGDVRTVPSDKDGRFVITAVQPANYSLQVTANGFTTWQENGIVMNMGSNKDVPNIKLGMGNVSTKVDVVAGGDSVVPTDTGEVATDLNEKMIDNFPLEGRNVGQLMTIMPGMAFNHSSSQGSGFNNISVGSNTGPVGDFSANGTQPNGTVAYMLDGADLVDPGNFGTQIANINPDMVGSIKFLTADYGVEYAYGPTIFEAFSRSGGQQFHGEAYLYARNAALNSVDAYTKSQGGTNAAQSYYYIGGNVGGPVLLPFTKWNHDRNKLFFWAGYEYMKQQPAGAIINYNVPNAAQLSGDFSNAGIPAAAINAWPAFYQPLLSSTLPAGGTTTSFPTSDIDPNIPGVLKLYPATNQTPSAGNGYTNYHYVNQSPQNRWEATGKLDYAISDNTKLTGSYSYQKESDLAPISIWWALPNTLPYPTPGASNTVSYVILTNFTHVFNPTTTNEAVFTWSHFVNPYKLANPSAVSRKTVGLQNVPGLFGLTTDQMPNFEPGYCCNSPMASFNYYPMTGGSFGGVKEVPAFYDNLTKVLGKHTLKAGFFWNDSRNSQNSNAPNNGTFAIETGGQNSTNNLVADTMLGRINQYSQQNKDIPTDTQFSDISFYLQDSWQATKRLTMVAGLRFQHIGQWHAIGADPGFQVWNLADYLANPTAPNAGILWHANTPSVPLSGFVTPAFYYDPRVSAAYDVFGTGKTVVRGGFAKYQYQATSETASAETGPLGSFEYQSQVPFNGYANVANLVPPSSVNQNGSSIDVMQQGDNRAPFTYDWNFTVSQQLPWRSVLEASYVGNHSENEYMDGTNSNLYNQNNVPIGGMFNPDPLTGVQQSPSSPCETGTPDGNQPIACVGRTTAYFNANDYRPLTGYQNIYLLTHAPYSNYNSLQVSFTKETGPITFLTNYTFSKVLGIRDGGSNNGPGNGTAVDPFVLNHNYGPLAYDHTHIVNLTYNWSLPSPVHGSSVLMKVLGGGVNGWKLSGYTTFQSGAPLQPALGGNMDAIYATGLTVPTIAHPNLPNNAITLPNGLIANSITPSVWFGTNAYNVLVPALTCDPSKGLKKGYYFNPSCFTTPAFGKQGQLIEPYMRNPSYWDSDLGVYKDFHITSVRYIQFRVTATNWLNHPLPQFGLANQNDESINFQQTTNASCSGCTNADGTPIQVISEATTNQNAQATGKPAFKTGARFVLFAAKFYF